MVVGSSFYNCMHSDQFNFGPILTRFAVCQLARGTVYYTVLCLRPWLAICRACMYSVESIYTSIQFHTPPLHSNVIYTGAFAHSMHFHSFETYRARVAGPVFVVGCGGEDGAALPAPRIGDFALVAGGEGRSGSEGVGHGGHLGDVPRVYTCP